MLNIFHTFLNIYRKLRVSYKRAIGNEPTIKIAIKTPLRYHGNRGYGGWAIPDAILNADSVVVDIGLGEDISFSESLISKYGCNVYGVDPTPKSISYVYNRNLKNFNLYALGVAGTNRTTTFYLPNNPAHVSGSIKNSAHVGKDQIEVKLIDIDKVLHLIEKDKIDLLKIDIEGAEYELLDSISFKNNAAHISILCVEFHHRWNEFGPKTTLAAVDTLRKLGFECVWRANESNEEFTFINTQLVSL